MENETNNETPDYTGQATYSPEDNKLRLYVGRVPRDEYLKLKAEGWTSTPKQNCDFVAKWTPERLKTALEYAEIIEDEDKGPEERAADRAERFAGYREKRTNEAIWGADRYDAGPSAHGFQNQARADRAATRHDRIAGRACDAWSKAEYWQRRTAGVIAHALYMSSPAVRMGRIKEIEAGLRRVEDRTDARGMQWAEHYRLRLAYENQMIEAQGGRAAHVEMVAGGFLGGRQIHKVNKSHETGRVVSVYVMGTWTGYTKASGYTERATLPKLVRIETERLAVDAYRPPTDEELAAFQAAQKAAKAAKPKVQKCPLINPTDEDAQKLQDSLNAQKLAEHCASHMRRYGKDYAEEFKPSTVCRISQAAYSEASKGAYARAETTGICAGGILEPRASNMWSAREKADAAARGPRLCEVRTTGSNGSDYGARRVIVIADKPQKPLPAAVLERFELVA